jgi:hypothetical protein
MNSTKAAEKNELTEMEDDRTSEDISIWMLVIQW